MLETALHRRSLWSVTPPSLDRTACFIPFVCGMLSIFGARSDVVPPPVPPAATRTKFPSGGTEARTPPSPSKVLHRRWKRRGRETFPFRASETLLCSNWTTLPLAITVAVKALTPGAARLAAADSLVIKVASSYLSLIHI